MEAQAQYQLPAITKQGLDVLLAALDVTLKVEGLKFADVAVQLKNWIGSAQEVKTPEAPAAADKSEFAPDVPEAPAE